MSVVINGVEFTTADWLTLMRADERLSPDGPAAIVDAYMGDSYDSSELRRALVVIGRAGDESERLIASAALDALGVEGNP